MIACKPGRGGWPLRLAKGRRCSWGEECRSSRLYSSLQDRSWGPERGGATSRWAMLGGCTPSWGENRRRSGPLEASQALYLTE
jgi:hypothetical protein